MNSNFHQINNEKVQEQYLTDNYCIEYDKTQPKEKCVIYFSSNSIYYPNTEENFIQTIVIKDHYEWKKNKVKDAHKHIFIRDIFKQWYLLGINHKINSIEKLTDFLKKETQGYQTTCIGSSAGGFAASLIGCYINAHKAFTFNGQFEVATLLDSEKNRQLNPLLVKNETNNDINKYFNIAPHISVKKTQIYYFNSAFSEWDNQQYEIVKYLENVKTIRFKTQVHGIPFELKDMHATLLAKEETLQKMTNKKPMTTLQYSIKLNGLILSIYTKLKRKFIRNA